MSPDEYCLGRRRGAAIGGCDRELSRVAAVSGVPVCWTAVAAARPIAELPCTGRDSHPARVERAVKELDRIEAGWVAGEEAEARDRRWRDLEAELGLATLAEQIPDQEVIGRAGLGAERHVPPERDAAELGQAAHRAAAVGGDHRRERRVADPGADRLGL